MWRAATKQTHVAPGVSDGVADGASGAGGRDRQRGRTMIQLVLPSLIPLILSLLLGVGVYLLFEGFAGQEGTDELHGRLHRDWGDRPWRRIRPLRACGGSSSRPRHGAASHGISSEIATASMAATSCGAPRPSVS